MCVTGVCHDVLQGKESVFVCVNPCVCRCMFGVFGEGRTLPIEYWGVGGKNVCGVVRVWGERLEHIGGMRRQVSSENVCGFGVELRAEQGVWDQMYLGILGWAGVLGEGQWGHISQDEPSEGHVLDLEASTHVCAGACQG